MRRHRTGFTLIEMLVSVVILLILMVFILMVIQMTQQAWKQSSQGANTMQEARGAFERLTRTLSQATLNTYYGYHYASGSTTPSYYMRQSELQFVSGSGSIASGTPFVNSSVGKAAQVTHGVFFQAPLGVIDMASASSQSNYGNLNVLLNACGYFVAYVKDDFRPSFLSSLTNQPPDEYRFRLMEYLQPSENLSIYSAGAVPSDGSMPAWISNGMPNLTTTQTSPITVRPLASNIVALIIMPEQFASGTSSNGQANTIYVNTQANTYNYDSAYQASTLTGGKQSSTANQLPPLVKVIMVAIDEASAIRLAAINPTASATSPPNLGQSQLFQNPANLLTVGGQEGDLEKFEDILNASGPGNVPVGNKLKLNYWVFQSDVAIRGSKWTSQ